MIQHSYAAAAVALFISTPAAAQTLARDLTALPHDVVTVYLFDINGTETKGDLLHCDADSLTLLTPVGPARFERDQIYRLYRQGDTLKNGMTYGGVIGLGIGTVAALAAPMTGCDDSGGASTVCAGVGKALLAMITVPVGALLGIGIGAGIDALHSGRTLIYEGPSASVAVAPVVSRHSTGIAFSIAW